MTTSAKFRWHANRRQLSLLAVALLLALTWGWQRLGHPAQPPLVVLHGPTMGTTYQIKIVADMTDQDQTALHASIRQILDEVNGQMSTYLQDSEISRFNRSDSVDWVGVSRDFAFVMNLSQSIHQASDGAFDPTVMPLVNAWGFGPEQRPAHAPAADEINRLKSRLGMNLVDVQLDPPSLRKRRGDISLDLSAIAKGFAVDRLSEHLDSKALAHHMVEVGGEMRTRGLNQLGQPWTIGIERPQTGSRVVQKALQLADAAVATSGSYRNYFEENGQRFSHTIDPRTGYPITHRMVSVSVIDRTCASADGWATAMLVAGPDRALAWAKTHRLAVYLIVMTDDGMIERTSEAFDRLYGLSKGI